MNDTSTAEHLIAHCISLMDQMNQCNTLKEGYALFAERLSDIIPIKTLATFFFDTHKPAIAYSLQFDLDTSTFQEQIPSYLSPSDIETIWDMRSPCIFPAYNLTVPEHRKKEIDFIIPLQSYSLKIGFLAIKLSRARFTSLLSPAQKSILIVCNYFAQFLAHHSHEQQIQTLREAFEETKSYVSNCLENMVHGIVTINTENRISTFSSGAELLFEIRHAQALGKDYHTVFSSSISKAIDIIQQRITQNAYVIETECEHLMHGKYRIPIAVSASQMQDADGKTTGIILLCKDRSLMKRLIALEELRKIKSEFFSAASHEIKNPLNLIMGSISILADSMAGEMNDQQLRLIDLIRNGSNRLRSLILSLLDISKADYELDSRSETIHIQSIVREAIVFHQNLALQKTITISHDFHRIPLYVTGTREKIFKIMDNLMSNALKYTLEGGTVQILIQPSIEPLAGNSDGRFHSSSSSGGWVNITVSDTGIGIPEEELPMLFTEFKRGAHHVVQSTEGTGLGLSIAKKIAESLGGSISVKSREGKGSAFTATLPLCVAEKEQQNNESHISTSL